MVSTIINVSKLLASPSSLVSSSNRISFGHVRRPSLPPRLTLRDFELIRPIGSGGFGTVYLVKHIPTGLELALKAIAKGSCDGNAVMREQQVLQQVGTRGTHAVMEFLGSFHNESYYFFVTVSQMSECWRS